MKVQMDFGVDGYSNGSQRQLLFKCDYSEEAFKVNFETVRYIDIFLCRSNLNCFRLMMLS